ncbi:LOB domain-containing protein 37-like [Lycium barbarum]|uniref:LOB domain-containing protein 37-like n=1 Tax=Lycium barbarum TaxID=112863 RepID=UPI00293E8E55|nr:LOB domain-containing protein 37-like [Lycium barbarum]
MSCNGCRVLRKGCHENCILKQSLEGIECPRAQANATVFVAKFFGRAGLTSFLSSVPDSQRSALFQSLLFEACGRTINPVNGVVGLLWTGNWHLCQSAVETVLQGGVLQALPEFSGMTGVGKVNRLKEKRRDTTPLNSDESDTTTFESGFVYQQNEQGNDTKLLRLFF